MRPDSVGCVTLQAAAARVKCFSRASAARYCSCRMSIEPLPRQAAVALLFCAQVSMVPDERDLAVAAIIEPSRRERQLRAGANPLPRSAGLLCHVVAL